MAKKPSDFPVNPKSVEVFFDVRDQSYWHKIGGTFLQLGVKNLHMQFRSMGLTDQPFGNGQREIDWPLWNAMNNRKIYFAGSLAGHRVGLFKDATGREYLITEQPHSSVFDDIPKKVKPPKFFAAFIEELLPDDQWQHFCFSASASLQSLRRGDFSPGQVSIFVGPSNCGKSLLQSIFTEMLGGRSANPYDYLAGNTQFNAELISAEHWAMEDPPSTTDIRSRRAFGEMLKNAAYTTDFKIHKKGKDGITMPIFRRISISVNDELENLSRCPPMDASLRDKINLYRCTPAVHTLAQFRLDTSALPGMENVSAKGKVDRLKLKQTIVAEMPQIRAWLLSQFANPPAAMSDGRNGVESFHHAELLNELSSLAPEMRLLQLIDFAFFSEEPPHSALVDIRSLDLEKKIHDAAPVQAAPIAKHQNWAGNYLSKLFKSANPGWKNSNDPQTGRILKRVKDGTTLWTIKPPSVTTAE